MSYKRKIKSTGNLINSAFYVLDCSTHDISGKYATP